MTSQLVCLLLFIGEKYAIKIMIMQKNITANLLLKTNQCRLRWHTL